MTEPGPTVRKPKSRIPLRRWALWGLVLVVGDLIFYVLLTPVWLGLRMLAWVAEFRGRRRQGRNTPCL